ncbi:MAG TPA: substrate-binding domain-containing protein [Tepidisphaeraceae bacterium]|jgi:LacI family transcriptional regulator|nr:substrate-binding domain-containing protein [Tepidisphaeraceae bacterium]
MALARVALLIERYPGYQEQVLRGVRHYATPSVDWLCQAVRPAQHLLAHVQEWGPEGIILGTSDEAIRQRVLDLGRPVVEVFQWLNPSERCPRIGLKDTQVGRLAAEHFLDRGYRSFGFIRGRTHAHFVRLREQGFADTLSEAGRTYAVYQQPEGDEEFNPGVLWSDGGPHLRDWVLELPKPVAVFALSDNWALRLLETCRMADVQVPEQVAVVGVDDDDILCLLAQPRLSSVATAAERIGYEAAALLDRMMHGAPLPDRDLLLPPVGVVTRQSSDAVAVGDPDVAAVLRLIHAAQPVRVDVAAVLAAVPVPRRTLERRFRAAVGRGIAEEMRRVRLDRAKRLLATSDDDMPAIAAAAGFGDAAKLSAAFRTSFDVTPSSYRHQFRNGR